MDLRAMLNESGPAAAAAPAPIKPPTQQQQQQHQQPHPSTPVGNGPQNAFRDFRSPADYPPQQSPYAASPSYPPTTPYGAPGRPAPPPLQPISNNELRSPSAGSMPGPSPYRHTPMSSVSGPSGGYPFPESASPVQQHRYPQPQPQPGAYPTRESFSQPAGPGPSPGPAGPHHPAYSQGQQQHSMPLSPPVATPGGAHPYLHQRSQSTHSTSTPTSAQSQHHPYGPHFASPIATNHSLPPHEQHMRQLSQPHTPLGPPPSAGPRHSSGQGTFAQPPSPYQQQQQQRAPSAGTYPPYPPQHQQPSPHAQPRPHPHPHPHPQHQPHPSYHSARGSYDKAPIHPHPAADPHRRSESQSERERSVSVSPKTRIPSLPSSSGHHSQSSISGPPGQPGPTLESDPRDPRDPRHTLPSNAPRMDVMSRERELERASTPAKRKMDDRDLRPEDVDRQQPRPPPFEANGSHIPHPSPHASVARSSASPMVARRKRRHQAPPVWAQVYDKQPLKAANFILRRPPSHPHVNGKAESVAPRARSERPSSRQVSPEASRSNVHIPHAQPQPQPQPPPQPQLQPGPELLFDGEVPKLLGPWERTISNSKPFDQMTQTVADFLFIHGPSNPEVGHIHGQDVQFEVEAKLGHIVDRSTGSRLDIGCTTECVVDNDRFSFVSSMTEVHHKQYNDFLNAMVHDAHALNPKNKNKPRVAIQYQHRHEIDKFYIIPPAMRQALHPAVQHLLAATGRPTKVRVSHEKSSGAVINKIIKVKVKDLHLHFPRAELDCRVSINLEVKWPGPVEELEQMTQTNGYRSSDDRHKNRMSYIQGRYQIDLTQVMSTVMGPNKTERLEKTHELEVELDADTLVAQAHLAMNGNTNNYEQLIHGFVDNVRLLARKTEQP